VKRRRNARCLAVSLATLALAVACARGRQDSASSRPTGCTETFAGALDTDSVSENGLFAVGDLDCDGSRDTVFIEKPGSTGAGRLIVRGSVTDAELPVLGDGGLRIAGFGDFNLDHVRDILVAEVDESVVSTEIVLVARDRLKVAAVAGSELVNQLQYLWDPTAGQAPCRVELMPRVVSVNARPAASIAYGTAVRVSDCMRPARQAWWVEHDTIAKAR